MSWEQDREQIITRMVVNTGIFALAFIWIWAKGCP